MGMARHAPMDTYRQSFNVLREAVFRFREIMKNTGLKLEHQPDTAVVRVIDEAVLRAINEKRYEMILDAVGETISQAMLVTLPEETTGKGVYAVVREDRFKKKTRDGSIQRIVVSIQDQQQVTWNKTNGKWRTPQSEPGKGLGKLGDKMPAGLLEKVIDNAAAMAAVSKIDPSFQKKWRISYVAEEGQPPTVEEFTVEQDMKDALEEIVEEGGADDVKVEALVLKPTWVELKKKVRVELAE